MNKLLPDNQLKMLFESIGSDQGSLFSKSSSTNIFGKKLDEDDISTIPVLLFTLFRVLHKTEIEKLSRGVFSKKGDEQEVKELKKVFDMDLEVTSSDLTDYSPHTIAVIIKEYFRNLDPRLLNVRPKDENWLEISKIKSEKMRRKAIKTVIDKYPKTYQKLVLELFKFLFRFSKTKRTRATMMGREELAIVFSPLLFSQEFFENVKEKKKEKKGKKKEKMKFRLSNFSMQLNKKHLKLFKILEIAISEYKFVFGLE